MLSNSSIIDLRSYTFIDPLFWTILYAEKKRRDEKGLKLQVLIDKDNPSYIYYQAITGRSECLNTVPMRIINSRAQIDNFTDELVKTMKLSDLDFDTEDEEFFKYIVAELVLNAIDHGESMAVVSAQRFPKINTIEICVADIGLGFFHTIRRRIPVKNPAEAIEKALQKGITGAINYLYGGVTRNAGMGLYVISRMVEDGKGLMYIVSDNTLYEFPKKKATLVSPKLWKGSIILIRFELNEFKKIIDLGFRNYLNMIISEDLEDEVF